MFCWKIVSRSTFNSHAYDVSFNGHIDSLEGPTCEPFQLPECMRPSSVQWRLSSNLFLVIYLRHHVAFSLILSYFKNNQIPQGHCWWTRLFNAESVIFVWTSILWWMISCLSLDDLLWQGYVNRIANCICKDELPGWNRRPQWTALDMSSQLSVSYTQCSPLFAGLVHADRFLSLPAIQKFVHFAYEHTHIDIWPQMPI